ncbi:DNA-binding response regulator, OmpR family, contains REC and winged-helix (wHTH) domain [Pseudarcicella hirudinis]|uniref:DNA-binding response regulator, OmpR family, contains REC and winged-helix (WHTH) domain n=1 Tax=Pseudarcicella hirudinis TaxID=1079859 RepID=A0A1I5UQ72_9BACT|nr:response regulator transcription factor [Pseudarcicella hirudinis]SFP97433.1 DNA-binding response regulator, OmpR family, contains REC and winged-helix (wHTH) domain [Pseudarcicella hirudinis]
MKVLIVEDEKELSKSIVNYLKQEQFVCETAECYAEAQDKIICYDYDCVLLDISLPDGNGFNLLELLKSQKKNDGVIIISAKNSIDDKIKGLTLGADDYLSKPFHLAELSARIKAIIRRKSFEGNNQVVIGQLVIDLNQKTASWGQDLLEFTRKELELLLFLLSNKEKVVSKKAIAEHLSGDNADLFPNFDFIYAHIKNLKKKMAEAGCPDYIQSVYGLGYKFVY